MGIRVTVDEVVKKGAVGIPEAQVILGVGKTAVYDLLKTRKLPFIRINSQRKIPLAALEKFIAERLTQGE